MNRHRSLMAALCLACGAANAQAADALTVRSALRSEATIAALCSEYGNRRNTYADLARQKAQQTEQLAFAVAQNNAAEVRRIEQQIEALSARMTLARNSADFYALKPFSHGVALRDTSPYLHFYLRDRHVPSPSTVQVSAVAPTAAQVSIDLLGEQAGATSGTSGLTITVRFRTTDRGSGEARTLMFVPTAHVSGNVGALCSAMSSGEPIAKWHVDFALDWPRLATQPIHYVVAADPDPDLVRRNDAAGQLHLLEGLSAFLERMLIDRSYRLIEDLAFRAQPSLIRMHAPGPNDRVDGPWLLTPNGAPGTPTVYEYQTLFNVFDAVAAEFGAASIVLTKQDLIALRGDLARAMRMEGDTLLLTWAKGGHALELCFRREPGHLRLSCVRMNGRSKWPLADERLNQPVSPQ
jgi:transposase-like protein